jgi:hypothetical protein
MKAADGYLRELSADRDRSCPGKRNNLLPIRPAQLVTVGDTADDDPVSTSANLEVEGRDATVRSFLTRLVNSVTRVVFLAPCLLVCLACATPFPFENLREGMTAEAVREEFGAPEAMDTYSCWSYVHERQNWAATLLLSWGIPFAAAICAAPGEDCEWKDFYVVANMVLLDFEEEKLVRWEMVEPIEIGWECSRPLFAKKWNPTTGRFEDDPFPDEKCGPVFGFPDPPTCTSIRGPPFPPDN